MADAGHPRRTAAAAEAAVARLPAGASASAAGASDATGAPAPGAQPAGAGSGLLIRGLGVFDATLLTVGSIVGTGIFLTTSNMARVLPHPRLILLVWLVGGLLTLAGALTYAELGVMFPRAGGQYQYLKEAYGPLWGFLFGWACFAVMMTAGHAALGVGFGEYLGGFFPFFSTRHVLLAVPVGRWTWAVSGGQVAAVLAIVGLTAVNHVGLRAGATVQNALTAIKLLAMLAMIVFGLTAPAPVAAAAASPAPAAGGGLLTAFGVAMIAAMWTYDGWYGLTGVAGEVRDPGRTLPRGLILGTGLVIVLYMLLNVVYLRALSIDALANSPRVAEAAVAALFGPGAARLISLAVLISTFGCLSASLLYTSRFYQPMAEDGLFFRSLAGVDPRFHTPVASLWAQAVWASVLALSGSYEQLYTCAVFALVVFHALTAVAVMVLRRTRPELPRPYRTWGYPVVPLLFVAGCLLLVGNTLVEKPVESLFGGGLLLLGLPAYLLFKARSTAARDDAAA